MPYYCRKQTSQTCQSWWLTSRQKNAVPKHSLHFCSCAFSFWKGDKKTKPSKLLVYQLSLLQNPNLGRPRYGCLAQIGLIAVWRVFERLSKTCVTNKVENVFFSFWGKFASQSSPLFILDLLVCMIKQRHHSPRMFTVCGR